MKSFLLSLPFLSACSLGPVELEEHEEASPLDWSVESPGDYHVGFTTWVHEYEVPLGESPRSIPINVWYPTHQSSGDPGAYLEGLYVDPLVVLDATPASAPEDAAEEPKEEVDEQYEAWRAARVKDRQSELDE